MADIELIIKISSVVYEQICKKKAWGEYLDGNENAIVNGIPLPKGHGGWIDACIIDDFKSRINSYKRDYKFSQEEVLNILKRYELKYAPTIIEADKESEEI